LQILINPNQVSTGDDIDMTTTAIQKLFTPVQEGPLSLSHRVVMAPLTRSRSQQPGDIPSDLMVEYYGQRLPLNPYDRNTFYTFDAHGYTDYPFYSANGGAVV
jgi:hypothetical protein